MLHRIYYTNPAGADNYMIVPFDEIKGTVTFLESLDYTSLPIGRLKEKDNYGRSITRLI